MKNTRHLSTPVFKMKKGLRLSKKDSPTNDQEKQHAPYAQAKGNLMHAMLYIRPDISYVVGPVSRYQSNSFVKYRKAMKRIFNYLKGTKHLKLYFQTNELEVIEYSDADFVEDRNDCKSTSGHVSLFGGVAFS